MAEIYHLFMSAYGWTIDEVEQLTVPQMLDLLKEIQKYPPTNVLLAEFLKGLGGGGKGANPLDIDRQLSKIPHTTMKDGKAGGRHVFSKTGNRIVKMVNKRTGKRII